MKGSRYLLILAVFLFCLLPVMPAEAAAESGTQDKKPMYKEKLVRTDGKVCYYDRKGKLVRNRWKTIKDKRYYFKKNGEAATGLTKISGVRYLFGSGGALKTNGFYKYEGNTYYVNARGKVQTGWKKIEGYRYFFNNKGVLQKSRWIRYDDNIYYVGGRGKLQKSRWLKIGDNTYYVGEKGILQKSRWIKVGNNTYYVDSAGILQKSRWISDGGKTYYVDSAGALQKERWIKYGNNTYYVNSTGALQKECWIKYGNNTYYVNSAGVLQKSRWISDGGKTYYVDSVGALQKERWISVEGKTYYVDSTGALQKNRWLSIGGKTYYVDSTGVLQKNQWIDGKYVGKDGVYDSSKKDLMKLKEKMESSIRSYKGSWSVYMKNLETGQYFSINNRRVYAASLIKLYAMGAVYARIAQGKISESSVRSTISSMITVSDNTSFNTIVKKVGLTYINQWCKENGYTGTNQGHGLSPSSNNYGLKNGSGSNVTSVVDCGKFLESVYRGTCVSASASKKMLGYLKKQQRRSKIPAGVPKGVVVANKTGETDNYTHDAAIVYSKNATYILVVMGSTPGSGWSSAKNITSLSRLAYNYLNP